MIVARQTMIASILVHAWSTASRTRLLPAAYRGTLSLASRRAYAQVRASFGWLSVGAPSRIRTCAHGSGGC
jgi:hypothetical protein